jgi:thiosulfate/3-mercaptopyruvate sulfurtransferase
MKSDSEKNQAMTYQTLIPVHVLEQHLEDPTFVVFDCRHDLMKPEAGAQAYANAHIPGARFAHSDRDLAGPKNGKNGRHPLPDPHVFANWLGRSGVDSTKQVVAYDHAGGASATRLWWMLRWLGHDRVAVLDGGWEAWVKAGAPVNAEVPKNKPAVFSASPRPLAVDVGYVQSHLNDPGMLIVDARSPERYRGETEPIDPVAGHIPGARNRLYKDNLDTSGRFKSAAELRAGFISLLGDRAAEHVVHQCGSGVSACHNILAMEIAGLTGSRLYPGSWSEWCADPARPIARG